MSMGVRAVFICVLLGIFGCHPNNDPFALDHTTPNSSTLTSKDIVPDESFLFWRHDGHFEFGWHSLELSGNGDVIYLHQDFTAQPPVNRLAKFTLSQNELDSLCGMLQSVGFAELPDGYHGTVVDGPFIDMRLQCQGESKHVLSNGHIPEVIQKVDRFVTQLVIEQHAAEIAQAQLVTDAETNGLFKPLP